MITKLDIALFVISERSGSTDAINRCFKLLIDIIGVCVNIALKLNTLAV